MLFWIFNYTQQGKETVKEIQHVVIRACMEIHCAIYTANSCSIFKTTTSLQVFDVIEVFYSGTPNNIIVRVSFFPSSGHICLLSAINFSLFHLLSLFFDYSLIYHKIDFNVIMSVHLSQKVIHFTAEFCYLIDGYRSLSQLEDDLYDGSVDDKSLFGVVIASLKWLHLIYIVSNGINNDRLDLFRASSKIMRCACIIAACIMYDRTCIHIQMWNTVFRLGHSVLSNYFREFWFHF